VSKIIIIAGDSWGCGEWENNNGNYRISHPGLTKYLIESGYSVINLSQPGGSNIKSETLIGRFLQTNTHIIPSHIIVFQTEWIRDIYETDATILNNDLALGYVDLKNRVMSRFWNQLSQICKKTSTPVYIIGGCSDTLWIDDVESNYPCLHVACQSVTNLLLENNHRILNPTHSIFTSLQVSQIDLIKKHLNNTDLELFLQDIEQGTKRLDLWKKNKEFFWPDGVHPNRHGHKILFEFLKTQIPGL